jgi:ParB family chromosome partitioning protein
METLKISNLESAPWRLTSKDTTCRETRNVVSSLKGHQQLRPILVRPLGADRFQIIEGHVVVDAAREAGIEELDCIVHDLDEEQALLIYLHLKLNRTVENHVKVGEAFKRVGDVEKIHQATCWKRERIRAYIETRECDENWWEFRHLPKDDGADDLPTVDL